MQQHIEDGTCKSERYKMLSKNEAPIANVIWKRQTHIERQTDRQTDRRHGMSTLVIPCRYVHSCVFHTPVIDRSALSTPVNSINPATCNRPG